MRLSITDVQRPAKSDSVFFNVLFELPEEEIAFVIPGWKIYDGKIYAPSRSSGKGYFSVILASPKLAKSVQTLVEESNIENIDLEPEAYTSAKWGQSGLKSVYRDDVDAIEVWKRYRGEKNATSV